MIIPFLIITTIFPLFFLPFLSDPLMMAKLFFLGFSLGLIFLWGVIRHWRTRPFYYSLTPLDLVLFLFLITGWLSWFFLPLGARGRSLLQPWGIGSLTLLVLFYWGLTQSKANQRARWFLAGLTGAGLLASLIMIVLFLLPDSFFPWGLINDQRWSPLGSSFILGQFLFPLIVWLIVYFWSHLNRLSWRQLSFLLPSLLLMTIAFGLSCYQNWRQRPVVLDWFSSWAIAVESFKRQPFLGLGPGNFNLAFDRYRPPEFNRSEYWHLRFAAPHSWWLQVWTELGLIGLVWLVLLVLHGWRLVQRQEPELRWFFLAAWLMPLIFPANLVNLLMAFLALALGRGLGEKKRFSLIIGETGRDWGAAVAASLMFLFLIIGGYLGIRAFWAEVLFYRALKAAAQNQGLTAYQNQLEAIKLNRFLIRFRLAFAQTNLALANGLAQKGEQLKEEEKQQISQLISQAINEAKAAVALEPKNVVAWESLAQIYRQLITVAQGADQWATVTYQQAIALDPLNPRLRVDYGGLLLALDQPKEAAKQFELAVNLKSDYANAWYNWAWALKQQDQLEEAIQRLQQAANLLTPETANYQKLTQELAQWRQELSSQSLPAEATSSAQSESKPVLKEPIKLPQEAAPPVENQSSNPS